MKQLLVAVAIVLGFVGCAEAKDAKLGQFYACKGTDPSGDVYQVYMETASLDGVNVYRQWLPNGHVIVFGQGFYDKDRFIAMQWFGGSWEQAAVMEYVIDGKTLKGKWNFQGSAAIFPETCTEAKESDIPKPVVETPDVPSIPAGAERL